MADKTLKEKRQEFLSQLAERKEWEKKQREEHPADWMPAYRPHAKSKEGVESMPTYYHTGDLANILKTYRVAKMFGAPAIPPEKLAAMALVEGRHDIGYNEWNTNNPRAKTLYNNLIQGGATPEAAGFSAAILDKHEQAQRLKIPFETAWNGTGTSIWNKTGKEYASKVKQAEKVLEHPKNQPLYNFIKQRVGVDENMPTVASADAVEMPSEYSDGNWKLI